MRQSRTVPTDHKNWLRAQHQPATIVELQTLLDEFGHDYNTRRPHRSLRHSATPAVAYTTRPKAAPGADGIDDPHWRVRHDRVDMSGKITLRHQGRMFKIGIGRHLARTPVVCLVKDLDIRIIAAATGEILRTLTLNTTRTYQPTGKPVGAPRNRSIRTPETGVRMCGCLATSPCGAGGNRTPVHQPVNEPATTIPGIASDAETPTGRLSARGGPRSVFPESQRSFLPSMVFPIVIPHFCCRAVMDWPRAAFLLTMTLHSSDRNQAARANCSSAILWFPRLTSLRNSGRKLEQRY